MKDLDVYGIGNAIMDLQVQVSEEALRELELNKGGMQLVDTAQQKALVEYFHGKEMLQRSGGSAANTIIALAQLGKKVSYGCVVGTDTFGEHYVTEMRSLGVDMHTPPADEPTGTCFIVITPDAERTMNTCLGASALFSKEHVSEEHISRAKWIYIEGYLFSSEAGQAAALHAAQLAKKHDTRIAVTFSDGFIVDVFGDHLRQVTEHADLVFANEVESKAFTGKTDEEAVFSALVDAFPNVAMTMHDRGARVSLGAETCFEPAFEIQALDATGAGDMFAAGFLYGILSDCGASQATRVANYLASKVVSQLGARLEGDLHKLLEMNDLSPAITS